MSRSLDGFVETPTRSLDWVRVDEVARLKAQPGLDMDVGGPRSPRR